MVSAASRAASFGPPWLAQRLAGLRPGAEPPAICVAFSGGADSTALLAALCRMRPKLKLLRALHVDHGLHPDSRRWVAHCRRVARTLGVPLTVRRAAVRIARGDSPEAAARAARYRILSGALARGEWLLTAHTQDDQLETVLLQLLRGAGLAGLAAMPEVAPVGAGLLVRPLLPLPRAALLGWLRAQGIPWVEDGSNAELRFDRNYLRARVLPLIHARWPAAGSAAARSARHAAQAQELLDALGEADVGRASHGRGLAAPLLRRLPFPRRCNALRFWIAAAGIRVPPTRRLEEIATTLLAARHDARPEVAWPDAIVRREGERLMLVPSPSATAGKSSAAALGEVRWRWRTAPCVLPAPFGTLAIERTARGPLDLGLLPATLTVRARRGGERLQPRHAGPRRALKQLLQETRVPPARRAGLPLLFSDGRLIAAGDLWVDASVQAGPAARERGRLLWSEPR